MSQRDSQNPTRQPAPRGPCFVLLGCLIFVLTGCAKLLSSSEVEASSATYVRTDSDDTTVVSPRGHVAGRLGGVLTFDGAYAMDSWTGASIDIMTAATDRVTEVRQEVSGGAGYTGEVLTFAGNYRYSTEEDYWSNGGSLRWAVDLFQRNTTLALVTFGAYDIVGRAGDPEFREPVWNAGARFTYTQVIDKKTVGEVSWETIRVGGFQSSPYRWVAIGGDGTCASPALYCVPETNPTERWRHAVNVRARRAIGKRLSLGGNYRYYFDSWGIQSHTLAPELSYLPNPRHRTRDILTFQYRYYTQGEATFYRPRYFDLQDTSGYVTRDRKLSAMFIHTGGLSYVHRFAAGNTGIVPRVGVSSAYSFIRYLAFVGLERVHALEITALFGAEFL